MSGFLLNTSSILICPHGGQAKPTVPFPRVKVMGQPIATQTAPYMIAGCANPVPPANIGPCVVAMWVKASLRIRAMGVPVLLQDSISICAPTPAPLNIILTQLRVKGM
jgi:hypothetical protein